VGSLHQVILVIGTPTPDLTTSKSALMMGRMAQTTEEHETNRLHTHMSHVFEGGAQAIFHVISLNRSQTAILASKETTAVASTIIELHHASDTRDLTEATVPLFLGLGWLRLALRLSLKVSDSQQPRTWQLPAAPPSGCRTWI